MKTLHLDVVGRAAINTDAADGRGLSVPTLVRVYQLRDGKTLERLTYDDLLSNADRMLRDDLLSERTLVIKPDGAALLSMPMEKTPVSSRWWPCSGHPTVNPTPGA